MQVLALMQYEVPKCKEWLINESRGADLNNFWVADSTYVENVLGK